MSVMPSTRRAIRAQLAASTRYDPATMRISNAGEVTARLDPDKTFAGRDPRRYLVGHVADLMREDDKPRT